MKLRIKGFKVDERNEWTAQQMRAFCEAAVIRIGGEGAWKILSPPLQRAVVAEQALMVITSNYRSVPVEAMRALLFDMLRLVGLEEV